MFRIFFWVGKRGNRVGQRKHQGEQSHTTQSRSLAVEGKESGIMTLPGESYPSERGRRL